MNIVSHKGAVARGTQTEVINVAFQKLCGFEVMPNR